MEFRIIGRSSSAPPNDSEDVIYLRMDNWNDYSFVTMFSLHVYDSAGQRQDIGDVKIGFKGQTVDTDTYHQFLTGFELLGEKFFSLGQGVDFYRKMASLPNGRGREILHRLRDIVLHPEIIEEIKDEKVFGTSLLRNVSLSVVKGQYSRVLDGKAELTDFKFKFVRPDDERFGGVNLDFDVEVDSKPSMNIHAVIGRNGVGKTTLLNGMIEAVTDRDNVSKFIDKNSWQAAEISEDYFSSLVSVSFSAFDPFVPPSEQSDPSKGTCYFYIGLKDRDDPDKHRTIPELREDCAKSLIHCFQSADKTVRWLKAISKLGSDENFASMKLEQLEISFRNIWSYKEAGEQSDSESFRKRYLYSVNQYLTKMSSGHAIVLLTITKLVARVEEKTLVLMDEPESHLHPPLLSAFIRALADLLNDRNGVAIIATHSPVVLQEIPKSCVWKIYRVGKDVRSSRPNNETFGENVGLLTSEVFSLEVERSGFHNLLAEAVDTGMSYEEIVASYQNQLGFEARAILRALVANRDRN